MPLIDQEGPNMPKTKISKALTLAAVAGIAMLAQGCTQFRGHQGYIGDSVLLTSVQAGVDNKDSVQATLGRPTFTGQFGSNDWYYFARDTKQLAFRNPRPTAQSNCSTAILIRRIRSRLRQALRRSISIATRACSSAPRSSNRCGSMPA